MAAQDPRHRHRPPHSCWALGPCSFPAAAASCPTVPVFEKMSCRMRGRRVTIPEPRGRKSLWEGKRTEVTHAAGLQGRKCDHTCGAIPSCKWGNVSRDTSPSQALGNALTLEGPEATRGRGGTGMKVADERYCFPLAGCAPAPACPKSPFMDRYLNNLPHTSKRSSVCVLPTCYKLI